MKNCSRYSLGSLVVSKGKFLPAWGPEQVLATRAQQVSFDVGASPQRKLGQRMDLVPRARPRAPHPRRFLLLVLLDQETRIDRPSPILTRPGVALLSVILGAPRSNALVLLSLGTSGFEALRLVNREIWCIFARLLDRTFAERRRLARLL